MFQFQNQLRILTLFSTEETFEKDIVKLITPRGNMSLEMFNLFDEIVQLSEIVTTSHKIQHLKYSLKTGGSSELTDKIS